MPMSVMMAAMHLILGYQVHLAFGATPRMVLPHFRVHGAGIDGSHRGLFAAGVTVVMWVMIHTHALF